MDKQRAEQVLGLSGYYDDKVLKDTYRRLLKQEHPDVVIARGGDKDAANAKMVEINAAYNYLDDFVKTMGYAQVSPAPGSGADNSASHEEQRATSTNAQPSGSTGNGSSQPNPSGFDWDAYFRAEREGQPDIASPGAPGAPIDVEPETASSEEIRADGFQEAPQKPSIIYRIVRGVLSHFPYKLTFLVLSAIWMLLEAGQSGLPFPDLLSLIPVTPELMLLSSGAMVASFINLLSGSITNPVRKALLWFVDKVFGRAPKERNIREALFRHLPYRLMFFGFAIWRYWDYATFHVSDGDPLRWPWLCLVCLVAGINMLFPLITDMLRLFLVGRDDSDDYYRS